MANELEKIVWISMIARCHTPSNSDFVHYGAKGIFVCKRWKESLQAFVDDMGSRPSLKYTIDRFDNKGSYTCGHCSECTEKKQGANCRWVTKMIQIANRSTSRVFLFQEKALSIKEISKITGIPYHKLYWRIVRNNWEVGKAISTPFYHSMEGAHGTVVSYSKSFVAEEIT